jgi:peptide/nickel transport system ATP-binding protein/oligopeptide transport system ATP-binding protein
MSKTINQDLERPQRTLLKIEELRIHFYTKEGIVKAVDGISLNIERGETLCLIGESGSGKTVTALSIVRLLPIPPARIVSGKIDFREQDLLKVKDKEIRRIRGGDIAYIFQDPLVSLNPLHTVVEQIAENLKLNRKMEPEEATFEAIRMMQIVGIPDAEQRATNYPHQFSGGMRQRVMTAIALSCNPALLIADEPTTALDVTIQAQVLDLIQKLKTIYKTSVLFITHNFSIVAEIADRVAVMYAGHIMEEGEVFTIFDSPAHPYTKDLYSSVLRLDKKTKKLEPIMGSSPSLINPPTGCRYHPRCIKAMSICTNEKPSRIEIGANHFVHCHLYCKKADSNSQ